MPCLGKTRNRSLQQTRSERRCRIPARNTRQGLPATGASPSCGCSPYGHRGRPYVLHEQRGFTVEEIFDSAADDGGPRIDFNEVWRKRTYDAHGTGHSQHIIPEKRLRPRLWPFFPSAHLGRTSFAPLRGRLRVFSNTAQKGLTSIG